MDATVLSGLHDTVQKVISGEMTEKQAVRIIRERFAGQDADALAAMGFAPKKDAQGVTQLASIRRIQLVMHTNVRMAQECGHYKQWEAVKAMYPYAIWHCGYAENHRRDHLSRDGKLYPFEHPVWRESPPGGEFNCHCWREPVMEEDAGAKGLTPQPMDSAFEPSSLGFDPSRPMSGEDVQPNKSVLPDLAQKAKADPCPDDILPDMDTNAAEEARKRAEEEARLKAEEEARRKEAIANALEERRKEMGNSTGDAAKELAKCKLNQKDVEIEVSHRFTEELEKRGYNVTQREYIAIEKDIKKIVSAEKREQLRNASRIVSDMVPKLYDEEAMKHGRPPKVVFAPECEKTELSPDGFELLIGKDISRHPEEVENVLNGLDFVGQMKRGQEFRREFARRQLEEAKILGIDVKGITFVKDLETRERLRDEAIKMTNQNFGTGLWEYHHNCQRCVVAAELRRKGFNVAAKPRLKQGFDIAAQKWEKLNAPAGSFFYTYKKPTEADVSAAVRNFGEGSRATVYVDWGNNSAHVFCAEMRHGKVLFYDPQSGDSNYVPFNRANGTLWGICRVDNVIQKDYINDVIEIKPGRI